MNPQFLSDSVMGIPLVAVVLGLVTWSEQIGVTGRWKFILSMGTGLVIGFFYHQTQHPAVTAFDYYSYCFYGLALGLVASGLYDTAKHVLRNEGRVARG